MTTTSPLSREIAERPDGYQGPDLSPGRLRLVPDPLGDRTWALMADLPPKDNNGLIVGEAAALVIDAGITPDVSGQIQQLTAQLTDRPLRYLINTTYHGDHTFGNAAFGDDVLIISSHANRAAMTDLDYEKARRAGNMYDQQDALDTVDTWRRPDLTFTGTAEIDLGGRTVELYHFGPGNGPGDVIAYDPTTRAAWTGNFLCHAGIPPMLLEGGPRPYLRSLYAMREALPDLRTVIPGHGPLGDGPDALDWLIDYLHTLEQRVTQLHEAGASVERTLAETPFPQAPEPSLTDALGHYQLPDPAATRARFSALMGHLHRLNVLATYRALDEDTGDPPR